MRILITGGSGFIGTNLIEYLQKRGYECLNLDWNEPLNILHLGVWQKCDIMDLKLLDKCFKQFQPDTVVHLAARTDTDIFDTNGNLDEYKQNVDGTQNVLCCIKNVGTVKKVIITSSMFVCKPGYMPKDEYDYAPFTLYGVSKVLTEKFTREANLACTWTIIRPQTIWGPWNLRYCDNLFKVLEQDLYFHPDKKDVWRSYGYIGNVVWQIHQILLSSHDEVDKKTLYVGDNPINLLDWVQELSFQLIYKPVRLLPSHMIKMIARVGDILKYLKLKFPITSSRYNSMIENYLTPISKTYNILGSPPYSMEEGIKEFVEWYRKEFNRKPIAKKTNRKVKTTFIRKPSIIKV